MILGGLRTRQQVKTRKQFCLDYCCAGVIFFRFGAHANECAHGRVHACAYALVYGCNRMPVHVRARWMNLYRIWFGFRPSIVRVRYLSAGFVRAGEWC